jgi:hypothetical protein
VPVCWKREVYIQLTLLVDSDTSDAGRGPSWPLGLRAERGMACLGKYGWKGWLMWKVCREMRRRWTQLNWMLSEQSLASSCYWRFWTAVMCSTALFMKRALMALWSFVQDWEWWVGALRWGDGLEAARIIQPRMLIRVLAGIIKKEQETNSALHCMGLGPETDCKWQEKF